MPAAAVIPAPIAYINGYALSTQGHVGTCTHIFITFFLSTGSPPHLVRIFPRMKQQTCPNPGPAAQRLTPMAACGYAHFERTHIFTVLTAVTKSIHPELHTITPAQHQPGEVPWCPDPGTTLPASGFTIPELQSPPALLISEKHTCGYICGYILCTNCSN